MTVTGDSFSTTPRPLARVFHTAVRARVALLAFLALAPPARAHEADRFTRFSGGGPKAADCMMLIDVEGVAGRPRSRSARCTDGDISCDGDGIVNGTCAFRVRICLGEQPAPAACHTEIITGAALSTTDGVFGEIGAALAALPMPAPADICTAEVQVPLLTRGERAGRAKLRAAATMVSGHADKDRLMFICRPADVPPPATFATIQEKIFTPLCSTASCHGGAAAGGLDLTPEVAYGTLVDVLAANPVARDAGLLRVSPGDPGNSFLFSKLTGVLGPGEGLAMPRVGALIPQKQIELVRRWILAGAPADAPF
jgi:hypothetical protein